MAIIINEIEVSVEVTGNSANAGSLILTSRQKEEIIKECIEKVMEILKEKNER
jgi:hypothetical protein